jgi:hypothetical protein
VDLSAPTLGKLTTAGILGRGGMAVVFALEATPRDPLRPWRYVVKIPHDVGVIQRRLVAYYVIRTRLADVHDACRLVDIAHDGPGGRPIGLVLERVCGLPLGEVAARSRLRLGRRRRIGLAAKLARAVNACVSRGMIPGDLNPNNALVALGSARDRLKLIDTDDLSLDARDPATGRVVSFHSPMAVKAHVAPELWGKADARHTEATVSYALGVLEYLLLTGRHPCAVPDDAAVDANLDRGVYADPPAWAPKAIRDLIAASFGRDSGRPKLADWVGGFGAWEKTIRRQRYGVLGCGGAALVTAVVGFAGLPPSSPTPPPATVVARPLAAPEVERNQPAIVAKVDKSPPVLDRTPRPSAEPATNPTPPPVAPKAERPSTPDRLRVAPKADYWARWAAVPDRLFATDATAELALKRLASDVRTTLDEVRRAGKPVPAEREVAGLLDRVQPGLTLDEYRALWGPLLGHLRALEDLLTD